MQYLDKDPTKVLAREQFVNQMMELSMRSRNKYLRKEVIKLIEKHGSIESIDLSDVNYIKGCK